MYSRTGASTPIIRPPAKLLTAPSTSNTNNRAGDNNIHTDMTEIDSIWNETVYSKLNNKVHSTTTLYYNYTLVLSTKSFYRATTSTTTTTTFSRPL